MSILAVDMGLRTGLASYGRDGRLRAVRSKHFGNRSTLRRAIPSIVRESGTPDDPVESIWLEGGGAIAETWERHADRAKLRYRRLDAEEWRRRLLLDRVTRSGEDAKRAAEVAARRVIDWSNLRQPASLRHDAAEAVLIGLYAAIREGLLAAPPW